MSTVLDTQRALVLQGGGALGAYEAGVIKAIYKKISEEGKPAESQLFDVIAGTSAGALSGAVLVSNFLKSGNWKDSVDRLIDFWNGLATTTFADLIIDMNLFVSFAWDYLHTINPNSSEAARRFWSSFQFDFTPIISLAISNFVRICNICWTNGNYSGMGRQKPDPSDDDLFLKLKVNMNLV